MIRNWFNYLKSIFISEDIPYEEFIKTNPYAMHSHIVRETIDQENIVVREFVVKIAEKIRRGVFSYRPFTDYSNGNGALEYNSPSLCYTLGEDIVSISIFLNRLVLRVGYTEIELNKSEEKDLYKEWKILVEQENSRHIENEKIEKEARVNKAISKVEKCFND